MPKEQTKQDTRAQETITMHSAKLSEKYYDVINKLKSDSI